MLVPSMSGLLLSLASACALHVFYRLYQNRRRLRGLPQPPHSFLWGHLKVMGEVASTMPPNMHPQAYLTAIAQKYDLKGIFYIDLWPIAPSQVVLIDPQLMDQVTVVKALAIHGLADDFLGPIIGRNGIATSNGATWKKTHNSMAPAFSWSNIRSLTDVVVDETMHFREILDRLAQSGSVFSMEKTSAALIFDVIGRVVFNFPLHAQLKGSPYLEDLHAMIQLAESQLSWNPAVKVKAFVKRQVILRRLHASITSKIDERLNFLKRENIVPSRKDPFSILDLMLREHLEQTKGQSTTDLPSEDLELLITNIKALLVGGHGTTTDTLCYIYMLLSKAPEIVQKLKDEHTRVFHADFDETIDILRNSPQKLGELEYTGAVIKECLRLFPVGFGVREAEKNATIDYKGIKYPIGDGLVVVANTHTLHYDASYFPNPSQFDPERFMDPTNSIPRTCFRTFGRGPRACLGQNLAQDELKAILLMTVRYYKFECADLTPNKTPKTSHTNLDTIFGDIIFQELGLEAKPRGGMMMKVRKIE